MLCCKDHRENGCSKIFIWNYCWKYHNVLTIRHRITFSFSHKPVFNEDCVNNCFTYPACRTNISVFPLVAFLCHVGRAEFPFPYVFCYNILFWKRLLQFSCAHMRPAGARFSKVPITFRAPVSRKSRNFSVLFRVSQFSLYLESGEIVSRQTSQLFLFFFCYLENTLKDQLTKTRGWQVRKRLLRPEKLSRLSRNRHWTRNSFTESQVLVLIGGMVF